MANHYILGIGHPITESEDTEPPAVYQRDANGNVMGLVQPSGSTLPLVLTLASTGVIASVTGTVSETALRTIPIPDGAMGANSRLVIKPVWQYTNSANNKIIAVKIGASLGGATTYYTRTRTTSNAEMPLIEIVNRGAVNSQVILYGQSGGYAVAQAANNITATYDFATASTNIYVTGTLANTGETIQLDSLWVDIVNPYQ